VINHNYHVENNRDQPDVKNRPKTKTFKTEFEAKDWAGKRGYKFHVQEVNGKYKLIYWKI